jgi:hypothetical protein
MVDTCVKSIILDFDYKYPFESDEDYQQYYLSIFGLDDFDEKVITEKTKALYEELKKNAEFIKLVKQLAGQMMSDDPEIGLYLLFSYSYIHDFLEILRKNKESKKGIENINFLKILKI